MTGPQRNLLLELIRRDQEYRKNLAHWIEMKHHIHHSQPPYPSRKERAIEFGPATCYAKQTADALVSQGFAVYADGPSDDLTYIALVEL